MNEINERNRINYANLKHHRQLIREQIKPQLIDKIEKSYTPSLNYQNAFKGVYMDELQKTLQFQEAKKHQYPNLQSKSTSSLLNNSNSMASSSLLETKKKVYTPVFTDYDEQRHNKFDELINKNERKGNGFFMAQDQYQQEKLKQAQFTHSCLQQQLNLKYEQLLKENEMNYLTAQEVKFNRMKQVQEEQGIQMEQRMKQQQHRRELQAKIEEERAKKQRKSLFTLGMIGRHNPITNPIQYHIDNPYILQKMQNKIL